VKETWSNSAQLQDPAFWDRLQVPELTHIGQELHDVSTGIPKKAQALEVKIQSQAAWVVFVGGTGTGKSTLYNGFCQVQVSRTGVERPKTLGAVVYAHEQAYIARHLPSFLHPIHRVDLDGISNGHSGQIQGVTLIEHTDPGLKSLVLVDTPDLDSLVTAHQELAQDILLLADVLVFVASQEKYADDVLYKALISFGHSGTDLYFVLNKADPPPGMEIGTLLKEVTDALDPDHAFLDSQRCVALPFVPAGESPADNAAVQEFVASVLSFYASGPGEEQRRTDLKMAWRSLQADLRRVADILDAERDAVGIWENRLRTLFEECVHRLLQREEAQFQAGQRRAVQEEIRNVFGRFDFLAGPRRIIGGCLRLPLRLLGMMDFRRSRQEDLEKAKGKGDARPVQEAVDELNAQVLERLMPENKDSFAARVLRRPDLVLTPQEVQARFNTVQDELAAWLNKRFERMAREAPRGKAWGIYSTSALWGVLIVSFETVVGGGLSLVEVAVDSAIAPYVTKGAVELFAYQELRVITRELSAKLEEGIVAIVGEQKDRYIRAMHELGPDEQAVAVVREWAGWPEQKALEILGTEGG
jgi:energy-coupling factor transporter ATP-binding protein EcfA2